jgi:hypothetical protein
MLLRSRSGAAAAAFHAALALALGLAGAAGCASRAASAADGAGTPACPRDASRDASGRCACAGGDLLLLGACVDPSLADAYCGPGARYEAGGCAYVPCGGGEILDVAAGACARRPSAAASCKPPDVAALESGEARCMAPGASCPRGTRRDAAVCARPRACPAGTLPTADGCRSIVAADGARRQTRVDVGAWAALVLGRDGGPASPELCHPLELRPGALGIPAGASVRIPLRVHLSIPDADVSRVHGDVWLSSAGGAGPPDRPASGTGSDAAAAIATAALAPLVEALRALGGESTTTELEAEVTCDLHGG